MIEIALLQRSAKNSQLSHVFCGVDYCPSEYFSVNCTGVSDVILMKSARYGRMQAGRCVSDYGKLGCFADVLWYMDRRCSGRRRCRVYVADPVLHRVDVCPSDLKSYLEANYTCVTGMLHQSISSSSGINSEV